MGRPGQLKQGGWQQSEHSVNLRGEKVPEGQEEECGLLCLLCFALFLSRTNSSIKIHLLKREVWTNVFHLTDLEESDRRINREPQ